MKKGSGDCMRCGNAIAWVDMGGELVLFLCEYCNLEFVVTRERAEQLIGIKLI